MIRIDRKAVRKKAQDRIHWGGGCALPESIEPEEVVCLIDELDEKDKIIEQLKKDLSRAENDYYTAFNKLQEEIQKGWERGYYPEKKNV